MSTIVGIKFKDNGKVYYFDPQNVSFQKGDGAIVETSRGVEFGTVEIVNCEVSDGEIKGELKKVVRKATEKDIAQRRANLEKRPAFLRDAQELANKRKLDIKIADVEFAFDGSKVIFYFTSDNRVDFRELVKDMASKFHMRIELRQIGIRDECKMKGGLGPCGRVCCCNSYMNDFARVSIKMAKHQGLSLNPTKISGLCGRLMCCLNFEDEYYADTLKFMPKLRSEIETPKGKGVVESVDILRQTVLVRFTDGEGSTEFCDFNLEQLGITPVYPEKSGAENVPADDEGDDIPAENTEE